MKEQSERQQCGAAELNRLFAALVIQRFRFCFDRYMSRGLRLLRAENDGAHVSGRWPAGGKATGANACQRRQRALRAARR